MTTASNESILGGSESAPMLNDVSDAQVIKPPNFENDPDKDADGEYIDEGSIAKQKRKLLKNLLLISFAFLCNFTAFGGVSNLQSSLNYEEGLGTGSLAVIYGSLIVSAMFTPTFVIDKCGCKWAICLSILGYLTYTLANFYPHWGTLIVSSIIVGMCAAPLWAAKCVYLTTAATKYARLTNELPDAVVGRFFGIFFLFFQFNNIVGNLISSFVLSAAETTAIEFPSCFEAEYVADYCGASDCQSDLAAAISDYNASNCPVSELERGKVAHTTLYTLMGIYTAIALCGALVVGFFVDAVETWSIPVREKKERAPLELFVASFQHMRQKRQLLLIPITMYSGFEQAFLTGDYTRSFITCPLAVNWVGFVLICYGSFDSAFSFIFGRLEKHTGRIPLFSLATVLNLALIIAFKVWTPYPNNPALFFIFPALWGVADAVWQTQLNAFYGVLFLTNQEASFANYRLWESIGFVIAFAYQNSICVSTKLWVLLGMLLVGFSAYCYVEYMQRRTSPGREKAESSDESSVDNTDHNVNSGYLQSTQSCARSNDVNASSV